MIELFKINKRIYDPKCVHHFDFVDSSEDIIRTRGHKYKLVQNHCHYELRKYNFTNRVIPIWKCLGLPNYVISIATVILSTRSQYI